MFPEVAAQGKDLDPAFPDRVAQTGQKGRTKVTNKIGSCC